VGQLALALGCTTVVVLAPLAWMRQRLLGRYGFVETPRLPTPHMHAWAIKQCLLPAL